jgi:hypothetical protein
MTPRNWGAERIELRLPGGEEVLRVPVEKWTDRAPERPGWKPFWVTINLKLTPCKEYTYRRVTEEV